MVMTQSEVVLQDSIVTFSEDKSAMTMHYSIKDPKGLIEVHVYSKRSNYLAQHNTDIEALVPSDMVCIGGGGVAVDQPMGALLTASYPNPSLTGWLASSKDHLEPNPHYLTTYAMGLKIPGLTRSQLMSSIIVVEQESGIQQHPEVSVDMPPEYVLIGGGFKVEWTGEGNLATASFPQDDCTWTARSKDHGKRSPANLRVYALGLKKHLSVGDVESVIKSVTSAILPHPAAMATMDRGYVLVGGGGDVHYGGQGNMLWKLQPTVNINTQGFIAASKDHIYPDPCSLTAYAVGIRIR